MWMNKVKAHAIGGDEGAFLIDVIAQDFAKGEVGNVG